MTCEDCGADYSGRCGFCAKFKSYSILDTVQKELNSEDLKDKSRCNCEECKWGK